MLIRECRLLAFLALLLVGGASLQSQALAPTLWTPEQKKFNHVGKMEFQPGVLIDELKGRNDLWYDGEYICIPGDEHHAPTCKKRTEWWHYALEPKTIFTLEDGKRMEESLVSCNELQDLFCVIALNWKTARLLDDSLTLDASARTGTFLYRVVIDKHHPGQYGVAVDYAEKQRDYYMRLLIADNRARVAASQPAFR